MRPFPDTPRLENAPDVVESGHLWLLEEVDGAPLRFQLRESGLLRFGDGERVYRDADDLPLSVQHAVRHVREHLDREALRAAVEDPESVVFYGVATRYQGVEYDWERLPAFLGVEVWSGAESAFRPPDATAAIFDRLGLDPVNTFERERRARDFDPESYTIPASNWRDGPAAGVRVRNKRGGRAVLENAGTREDPDPLDYPADELAEAYATPERFETVAERLRERGMAVTVDALFERVVEEIAREEHARLDAGKTHLDEAAFRSAVARRAREYLGG
ncbi:MAG: hypothetical protein ABEH90_09925 [Halolamina sp.]